jgi:hypothetical protein
VDVLVKEVVLSESYGVSSGCGSGPQRSQPHCVVIPGGLEMYFLLRGMFVGSRYQD